MSKYPINWTNGKIDCTILFSISGLATQILVSSKDNNSYLLIDVGDGTARDLFELKKDLIFKEISIILFTHGHYDHCGGIHSLLGIMRMLNRTKPLTIIYPQGCKEVEGLISNFQTVYGKTIPFKIIQHEIVDSNKEEIIFINNWKITPVFVVHYSSILGSNVHSRVPALGFRIKYGKSIIAFSGDTGPTDTLDELFTEDVDLAICEATYPDKRFISNNNTIRYHLTLDEAKEITQKCKKTIFIHRLPEFVRERLDLD